MSNPYPSKSALLKLYELDNAEWAPEILEAIELLKANDLLAFHSTEEVPITQRFQRLVNACSRENESGTPDFILADYLAGALALLEQTINHRDKWHGLDARLGSFKIGKHPCPSPSNPPGEPT